MFVSTLGSNILQLLAGPINARSWFDKKLNYLLIMFRQCFFAIKLFDHNRTCFNEGQLSYTLLGQTLLIPRIQKCQKSTLIHETQRDATRVVVPS